MRATLSRLSLLALAGMVSTGAAAAAESQVSFKGKQITVAVGSSAGGGYDTFTRTLAPHFARHLPGEPSYIVQNMPGAGSLKLTNYLYNVAPKDGTVSGGVNPDVVTQPLLNPKRAKFDPLKFVWLGSILRETSLSVSWHTSPIQTFDDVFKRELIVAATGGGSTIFPAFLNSLLGTKYKLVRGYKGLKEGMLAMERGEVTGTGSITWASLKATHGKWLKDGKVRLLVQFGVEKHPELTNVPWIFDFARNDDDRAALNLVFVRQEYGRPYLAPPGLAAPVAKALQTAFDATMKDPAFVADVKKRNLEVDAITGQEMERLIRKVYATPLPIVERVRGILDSDK